MKNHQLKLIEEIKYRRVVIGWLLLKVKAIFDREQAKQKAEELGEYSDEILKHRSILAGLVLAATHCDDSKFILTAAEVDAEELAELTALLKPTDPATGDIISFSA